MNFYLNKINKNLDYRIIAVFIVLGFVISCLLLTISYVLVQRDSYKEKISAYECGFEPFEDARNKFDIRFYIVAILFLIFDIEVIYLFPWVVSLGTLVNNLGFQAMILFLIILILGFIYEIYMNALDWQ